MLEVNVKILGTDVHINPVSVIRFSSARKT